MLNGRIYTKPNEKARCTRYKLTAGSAMQGAHSPHPHKSKVTKHTVKSDLVSLNIIIYEGLGHKFLEYSA